MAQLVVVLSGPVAAGKSTLARHLHERYGGSLVKTQRALRERAEAEGLGDIHGRRELQEYGERLDAETDGRWVAEVARRQVDQVDGGLVIIDAVRIASQIEALRSEFGRRLVHVHIMNSSDSELSERYARRTAEGATGLDELPDYAQVIVNPTEASVPRLADVADAVLDTHRSSPRDVLVRCVARLGLLPALTAPLVDVLVGGQYGSEGKGNIAYYLAPEYEVLVRVGGPNAGHQVPHTPVATHRSLPSGALANPTARLIIGPGAVINPRVLLDEIDATGVARDRITIDPSAMIITPQDMEDERALVKGIGSTGQGVGRATARRILGRNPEAPTLLARDAAELAEFIGDTGELLTDAFARGNRVLLEGTQGTGLSLYHGQYPYVTSRDTTVAGTLAEAGIAPRRVRRVVLTCRTYPIRVGGPSGPIGEGNRDLSWEQIEDRAHLTSGSIVEQGSVSGKARRVAEFDWSLLRRSAELNGATDVALTFADYIDVSNKGAVRYDQLTDETIRLVEEVEQVAGAEASLIATDFSKRSIIDRRAWRSLI